MNVFQLLSYLSYADSIYNWYIYTLYTYDLLIV